MKRGEHGKRNYIKARILKFIIMGVNTYQGLTIAMQPEYYKIPSDNREEAYFKMDGASNKDVRYHLTHPKHGMVALGILSRDGRKYKINMRSIKNMTALVDVLHASGEFELLYESLLETYLKIKRIPPTWLITKHEWVLKYYNRDLAVFLQKRDNLKECIMDYSFGTTGSCSKRFEDYLNPPEEGLEPEISQFFKKRLEEHIKNVIAEHQKMRIDEYSRFND